LNKKPAIFLAPKTLKPTYNSEEFQQFPGTRTSQFKGTARLWIENGWERMRAAGEGGKTGRERVERGVK